MRTRPYPYSTKSGFNRLISSNLPGLDEMRKPVRPMMASLTAKLSSRPGWIREENGAAFRALGSPRGKKMSPHSHKLKEITADFPEMIEV